MTLMLDALWRALKDCLRGRVLLLTILPLLFMLVLVGLFAHWGFDPAVRGMEGWLHGGLLHRSAIQLGLWLVIPTLVNLLAPLLVLLLSAPVLILLTLAAVELLLSPLLLRLVVRQRFSHLQRRNGAGPLLAVAWTLGHIAWGGMLMLVSLPLWLLLPPVALLWPPLLWGWVSYRIMSFDALADMASQDERQTLLRQHRTPLLLMGIATGLAGLAPGVVWLSTAVFALAFVVLIPAAIWIYTLVLCLSFLWFTHYCLTALEQLRMQTNSPTPERGNPPPHMP